MKKIVVLLMLLSVYVAFIHGLVIGRHTATPPPRDDVFSGEQLSGAWATMLRAETGVR